jgi:hypothetical protein
MVSLDIGGQLSNALSAACSSQASVVINGDATGVIATVLKPLEAFDQNWGDVARSDGANDAAHRLSPENVLLCSIRIEILFHFYFIYEINIVSI